MIMSTLMLAWARGWKIAAATPGLSATLCKVICASSLEKAIPVTTCSSTISSSLQISVPGRGLAGSSKDDRTKVLHPVDHRHFDRAHLKHLGPERGHFQHFLEGDLVKPPRLGNDARVGGVDPVDVGIDVAALRMDRRRDRHRAGVRTAAPERGRPGRSPDRRPGSRRSPRPAVRPKPSINPAPSMSGDARRAMGVIGFDRNLPALPGARRHAHFLKDDGQQAGGDLFAGGDHRVIFARRRIAC